MDKKKTLVIGHNTKKGFELDIFEGLAKMKILLSFIGLSGRL